MSRALSYVNIERYGYYAHTQIYPQYPKYISNNGACLFNSQMRFTFYVMFDQKSAHRKTAGWEYAFIVGFFYFDNLFGTFSFILIKKIEVIKK